MFAGLLATTLSSLENIDFFGAQPGISLVKPRVPALQGAQDNIFRSHLATEN